MFLYMPQEKLSPIEFETCDLSYAVAVIICFLRWASSGFLFTFVLQNKKGSSFLCVKRENNDVIQSLAIFSLSLFIKNNMLSLRCHWIHSLKIVKLPSHPSSNDPILLCQYWLFNVTRFDYFLSIKRNIRSKVRPFMVFPPPPKVFAFIRLSVLPVCQVELFRNAFIEKTKRFFLFSCT